MKKQKFISSLRNKLSALPKKDVEERLAFYSEAIDDRIEEGLSEDDAVKEMGSVDDVYTQIINQTPLTNIVKEKLKTKKQHNAWEIVLLVFSSPILISLLAAAFSVFITLYATLWSLIISAWAIFASLVICAPAGVVLGVIYMFMGNVSSGFAVAGLGIISGGLSVFAFFGSLKATAGTISLTKKMVLATKDRLTRKEMDE